MSRFLLSAFGLAGALALSLSAAQAQDCDRYAWGCTGWSGPQGSGYAPFGARAAQPIPQGGGYATGNPRVVAPLPPAGYDRSTDMRYASLYGPAAGEPFPVPALNLSEVDPAFLRASVAYLGAEPAGTIVVDPAHHYLYFVQGSGRAIRYGVGVGRAGFGWSGTAVIHDKQKWPDWYPPKEMIERQASLKKELTTLQSGIGMKGGLGNPLGGRALYLWQGNKDTLYRIHGTVEPWTIGKSVSSGCIRMLNQDVIDLYDRAAVGTKVVVLGGRGR